MSHSVHNKVSKLKRKGGGNIKFYGIDFGIQYIVFHDGEHEYSIHFKSDFFSGVKDVAFYKDGVFTEVAVNSTRPNIFGRIRYLTELTAMRVKRKLKNYKSLK